MTFEWGGYATLDAHRFSFANPGMSDHLDNLGHLSRQAAERRYLGDLLADRLVACWPDEQRRKATRIKSILVIQF
jgi:hypothetical protein